MPKDVFMLLRSGNVARFNDILQAATDITLPDIAHSLSLQCRFGGHLQFHYSIAQHSLLMLEEARKLSEGKPKLSFLKEVLLHDAHESIVGDVVAPLLYFQEEFREVVWEAESAFRHRFGLPPSESLKVKELDLRMCATELDQLFSDCLMKDKALSDLKRQGIRPFEDLIIRERAWQDVEIELLATLVSMGIRC
jgi:5'-deoxynucleotidase YfbR-like HD superfamily hydrolase